MLSFATWAMAAIVMVSSGGTPVEADVLLDSPTRHVPHVTCR